MTTIHRAYCIDCERDVPVQAVAGTMRYTPHRLIIGGHVNCIGSCDVVLSPVTTTTIAPPQPRPMAVAAAMPFNSAAFRDALDDGPRAEKTNDELYDDQLAAIARGR